MLSLGTPTCKANIGLRNDADDQNLCTKGIPASNWSQNHSILISAREEEYHYYSASYTIGLQTENNLFHIIWANYRLPDIRVSNHYYMHIFFFRILIENNEVR